LSNSSGAGWCIALGSLQKGLKGRALYQPGDTWYGWQIQYLSHELAHVSGAGSPEYYNYRYLVDYSNRAPFSELHSGAPYAGGTLERLWEDYYPEYIDDPMLQKRDHMIFGPLSALLYNRDLTRLYDNHEDVTVQFWQQRLQSVLLRVIDENGNPLSGVTIEGYAYSGASPSSQAATSRLEITAATDAQGEAVINYMYQPPDPPKIYSWRDARTIKFFKEGYLARGIFLTMTMLEEAYFVQRQEPTVTVRLLPGVQTCSDSDAGENTAVAGQLTYNTYANNEIRTLDYTQTEIVQAVFGDYCWFGYIREGSCLSGAPRVRYVSCPNSCLQMTGVCAG